MMKQYRTYVRKNSKKGLKIYRKRGIINIENMKRRRIMRRYIKRLMITGVAGALSLCISMTAYAGNWMQDSTGWWYQDNDGNYPVNTWRLIDDTWYRFDENGYMVTGWFFDGTNWFYMDPFGRMLAETWEAILGKRYYFDGSGYMAAGFYNIGEARYYFEKDGSLVRQNFKKGDQYYEVDSDGMITNITDEPDGSAFSYLGGSLGSVLRDDLNDGEAERVTELVNKERRSAGVGSVTLDDELSAAAQIRAEELVEFFSHDRPDGSSGFTVLTDQGITYTSCGENIASGQSTAKQVMNDWMSSAGHKNNILRKSFSRIGVGCYTDNGTTYWVQLFISK